jgi:predicted metal-dependent hydrolase
MPHPEEDHLPQRCHDDAQWFFYGLRLHNAGYYWETHEVLEHLWHDAGRASTSHGCLLQALILVSASHLQSYGLERDGEKALLNAKQKASKAGTQVFYNWGNGELILKTIQTYQQDHQLILWSIESSSTKVSAR